MQNKSRPPISAELRRKVLLEAGHRCAIPTCKFPDVDVHHIAPWSKVKEHEFSNLIALCPNCHRRSHTGEIDRKSLLMYKARLNALFGSELFKQPSFQIEPKIRIKSLSENYQAELYSEDSTQNNYFIKIEYPKFTNTYSEFINELIEDKISKIHAELFDLSTDHNRFSSIKYYVEGVFHLGLNTPMVVSLRNNFSSYEGGAHGSQWIEILNYRIDQKIEIHIEDLFLIPRFGIQKIRKIQLKQ